MDHALITDPVSLLPDVDALYDKTHVVRKARIANLKEELQRLGASRDWDELTLYADEVVLDLTGVKTFGFDLTDRSRFSLLARKMTILGDGHFVLLTATPGKDTVAEIAVQEFVGRPIGFATAGGKKNISIPEKRPAEGPVRIEARVELDSSVVSESLDRKRLGWKTGSEFYWSMVSAFQYGFARIDTDRDEARRTFLWVYQNTRVPSWWADANLEMLSMATQSAAMVSRLSQTPPPWPVPIRDLRALKQSIDTRMGEAQKLEAQYEIYVNRKLDAEARRQALARAIVEAKAQEAEADRQITAAEAELAKAERAYEQDFARVRNQNKTLLDRAADFEKGMKKAELILIAKAVGALGTSIAALGGGGDPRALTKIAEVAAEAPGRLDRLIAAIKKIAEPIEKIARVAVVLKDAYKAVAQVKSAFDPGRELKTFQDKDDQGALAITDTEWKVLREQFDATLRPFTSGEEKVDGASEYLEAGRVLVIYGEALCATHVRVTKLRERVVNLTMKRKMFEVQQQRLASYEKGDKLVGAVFQEAELLLRQRYLDMKRGLLFEFEDFSDAYRYWALREPTSRRLRLTSRVAEMAEIKVDLQSMIDDGLTALFGVKQQRVICHITYRLSHVERELLARGEPVVISVRPTEPGLKGWARVRIEDVQRVALDDLSTAPGNAGKNFRCLLRNSGAFVDSWGGKRFEFVAPDSQEHTQSRIVEPLTEADKHDANTILTSEGGGTGGDLGQFTNLPYYLPGLFTDWVLLLPRGLADNDSLDLSTLESIKVRFAGWAMNNNAV
ncbi:hypothetical protein BE17_05450 [Sorangium cellulosum]|uniref:Uncharacterized protein n=1 Tax=Sorangium cellulosum TaxID=56 RepID=A0A150RJR4_SORCE|nr:hypothetical protein BE17_05450 [Sorangium cellulosum]